MLRLAQKPRTYRHYLFACVFMFSNQIRTSQYALCCQAEDFLIGWCKVAQGLTGHCQVLSYTQCPQPSHEHHKLWSIIKSLVSEINDFICFDKVYSTSTLWERLVAFAQY